jgi:TolA-binding protein
MHNSVYKLLKQIKSAAAMGSGSFLPPEPLPNSVKANQIQQQELDAQQGEATAGAGNEQLMQMQKAQEDAVSQLQQTQQQLAQAQSELQNSQAQSQQQQQATQMQAQQEIQKAQMDAQYELQSEKIKNQQQLLSVQEKYMRSAGKAKPDQNHILSSQLKRVVRKVNGLKSANTTTAGLKATGMAAGKTLARAMPVAGAAISGASAVNNLSKGNYLSAGLDALGAGASYASAIAPYIGVPLSIGLGAASSYFENPEKAAPVQPTTPTEPASSGFGEQLASMAPALGNLFGGMGQQAGGAAPQQKSWDSGLSPSDRFSVLNQSIGKVAAELSKGAPATAEYPDIRTFMKNPPPPGEHIASPMPILQAGFKQQDFNMPEVRNQGYGPIGDFIKQVIFQYGLPMLGMRNPMQPDYSKVYGSLANNEAYKFKAPNTF